VGPARRSRRYCGRRAFPEEQHDGPIPRWAPPDDVAVQSQAEGRRWVLSASRRRDLAGSRTRLHLAGDWSRRGPYVSERQRRTVPEDDSADGKGPGLPAARSREAAPAGGRGRPGRVRRHRAAAVPGTGAAERARPDPAAARSAWPAPRAIIASTPRTTRGGPGRSRPVTTYSWRKPYASSSKRSQIDAESKIGRSAGRRQLPAE
jgi:hypothetical protein